MTDTLATLAAVIQERKEQPREGSYTCRLFAAGQAEILKKVGEEASEVIVAGALEDDERLIYECADLVYHLMVALAAHDLSWQDVEDELRRRFK